MAEYNLILPAMGEGVMEATITNWLKKEGDLIQADESVVEIATDKVDSDVPCEVSGKLVKILKKLNEVAQIGEAIAIIETNDSNSEEINTKSDETPEIKELISPLETHQKIKIDSTTENFLSPLVKSIIKEEGISENEIQEIHGTGLDGRITKEDLKIYLANRNKPKEIEVKPVELKNTQEKITIEIPHNSSNQSITSSKVVISPNDEIIEMDRMRSLISNYMVESKKISPHVTSFIEADVTNLVLWRLKNKSHFEQRTGEKLTYTPLFVHAIVKAIQDFPMINISVYDNKIIKKKNINVGVAAALPNGNLIVPVIKNADQLSISGLAKTINDLVERARKSELKPSDITEGTYTLTNIGTFGNLMGTPIINQPQVAIMAVGVIQKKVSVIETPTGDTIGIRHKMYLSHTYDHRVVDGSLGGMFLKRVSDYLQNFDLKTEV